MVVTSGLPDEASEDSADDSAKKPEADRTGMFTTGIISTREGQKIALFFSGRQHAGENLEDVLAQRVADLPPPIQMCDALSRNLPGELKTILGQLSGPRPAAVRGCGESVSRGVPACAGGALRTLSQRRDRPEAESFAAGAIALSPSPERSDHGGTSRLACPAVRRATRGAQLRAGRGHLLSAEALGEADAISARGRGTLDNNICERALKKVILHRKNALFYKTCHGAHVGDIFMSLIYTCELCGTNPFDYLSELDRHATTSSPQPLGLDALELSADTRRHLQAVRGLDMPKHHPKKVVKTTDVAARLYKAVANRRKGDLIDILWNLPKNIATFSADSMGAARTGSPAPELMAAARQAISGGLDFLFSGG